MGKWTRGAVNNVIRRSGGRDRGLVYWKELTEFCFGRAANGEKLERKGVEEEEGEGYWKDLKELWYGRAKNVEKPEKKAIKEEEGKTKEGEGKKTEDGKEGENGEEGKKGEGEGGEGKNGGGEGKKTEVEGGAGKNGEGEGKKTEGEGGEEKKGEGEGKKTEGEGGEGKKTEGEGKKTEGEGKKTEGEGGEGKKAEGEGKKTEGEGGEGKKAEEEGKKTEDGKEGGEKGGEGPVIPVRALLAFVSDVMVIGAAADTLLKVMGGASWVDKKGFDQASSDFKKSLLGIDSRETNDTTRSVSAMVESLTRGVAELKQEVADANWKLDKLLPPDSPRPPRLETSARVPPASESPESEPPAVLAINSRIGSENDDGGSGEVYRVVGSGEARTTTLGPSLDSEWRFPGGGLRRWDEGDSNDFKTVPPICQPKQNRLNPPLASILKSPPLVRSPVPTLATIVGDSQVATTRAVVDVVLGEGEELALLDVAGFGVGKSSILNEDGGGGVTEGVRWTERGGRRGGEREFYLFISNSTVIRYLE
ncbi:hypothetical protein RHMOL_Rhmol04G0345000 [Rhododendron molle]|uniref:Uncharacterized protein n=1 Tax=Rhododendron molle TaxID=49168 RepID=A0ACC0P747_RHOML|nr:hypothetical protein RHMOL_Rhmol04G0345000 [Rhododendron molle]